MTDRDPDPNVSEQEGPVSTPLLDDGQIEPITPDDIQDALDAFDDEYPDLAGLLDADPV
jgi:hypothetical protein